MTREEAITMLKKLRTFHNGTYAKPIDMAISALSADIVPREHFDTLKENYDMISKLLKEEHSKAVGKTEPSNMAISALEVQNCNIKTQNDGKGECFADSDLISRGKAIQELLSFRDSRAKGVSVYDLGFVDGINHSINMIDLVPSVSAERVVRCKDCKYNENGTCFVLMCVSFDDFFCGYAKMKGGTE